MENIETTQKGAVVTNPPQGFGPPATDQEIEHDLVDRGLGVADNEKRDLADDPTEVTHPSSPPRQQSSPDERDDQSNWPDRVRQTARRAAHESRAAAHQAQQAVKSKSQEALDYVRSHSVDEMVRDARSAATRHPAWVLGGLAAVVGLTTLRLLRRH